MARIRSASFPVIGQKDLVNPVIFVVDMINGFIKEGALHDEEIMKCVMPIQRLLEDVSCRRIFIADAHPPKTREFLAYPPHCVIGTSESEIVCELQPYVEYVFHKNSTNAFTCYDMQEFLKTEIDMYGDIIITGCCTDICVLQFALCLNAWLNEHNMQQHRVIVPADCVDTYHTDNVHDAYAQNQFALANMQANGIMVVSHIER